MANNVILSCFACTGKTTAAKMWALMPGQVNDLESSVYQWIYPEGTDKSNVEALKGETKKSKNPLWPRNYINAIKESWQNYRVTLISMQQDVRDMLDHEAIYYVVVYPSYDQKDLIIERARSRGNQEAFINLLEVKWDEWHNDLSDYDGPKHEITANETITDVIDICGYLD